MRKSGIFIFTKDRPDVLASALSSMKKTKYPIFVVDDSIKDKSRTENKRLVTGSVQTYLGIDEFVSFSYSITDDPSKLSFFLRPLGNKFWNLGYARNFALLYSKALSLENVLFMDDDIQVTSLEIMDTLFEALWVYKFSGAHIAGLIDDSVLGHIATDLNIHNERMLSGGFMAFKPNRITDYFFNIYNEDWIWLFMQLKGESYIQTGEVLQESKDPLAAFQDKITFQEFGEVALDGILDLYNGSSYGTLTCANFWERITKERDEYLRKLCEASLEKGLKNHYQIVNYVRANSKCLTPIVFKTLFEEYFNNRNSFQKLFNSM